MAERALHEWRHEAHLVGRLDSVRALVSARGASAEESALARRELVEAAGLEPGTVVGVTDRTGRVLSISDDGASAGPGLVCAGAHGDRGAASPRDPVGGRGLRQP